MLIEIPASAPHAGKDSQNAAQRDDPRKRDDLKAKMILENPFDAGDDRKAHKDA
ncbi:MAG TPA: hypothetical protein VMD30_02925 [Tepidisphaeraceae bacterium]|nr:hypothetical protein [Tepidisphaeraceae bacterium]